MSAAEPPQSTGHARTTAPHSPPDGAVPRGAVPGGADADFGDGSWPLVARWISRSCQLIGASAEALNTLNVFPIADSDTGSNLELTLLGIAQLCESPLPPTREQLVSAAIVSAHGNSGAILAEMVTSLAHSFCASPSGSPTGGERVAVALRTVSDAATRAVAKPVAGTILSVADAAATAAATAAQGRPASALAVAEAAQQSAAAALASTPDQLAALRDAGVVDAGGQAFVLLLDVVVEVLGGIPARPLLSVAAPRHQSSAPGTGAGEYEVMYVVSGADQPARDALRRRLSELGSSVVVVGDEAMAQVHVHLPAAGAAVEVGLSYGTLSGIRITALGGERGLRARSVVVMAAGPGVAQAVEAMGGIPVLSSSAHSWAELAGVLRSSCDDLVLVPNDATSLEVATHLARSDPGDGRRIAVLPTVAQVSGLAALAVHEPTTDFDAAVVAMSRAAGHARQGAVTIAERAALTVGGRCSAGDVLGVVEGDVVEIGDQLAMVAANVMGRLLAGGGELVTLLVGAEAEPGLAEEVARSVRERATGVEVEIVAGGQPRYPLLIGVE